MDIVCYVFDGITALDIVGPYEVLARLPGARTRFVGERVGPVRTDNQILGIVADHARADVTEADILVMPGGFATRNLEHDAALLEWIRAIDATTTWTTSVCTGSMLLAAAGLLEGKRATTHWSSLERLREYGAEPVTERVVEQGKYVTAAGVSSGIDMALTLMGRVAGPEVAQAIQLSIEYDPQPPFDSGSVQKAPASVVELVTAVMEQRRREVSGSRERAPGGLCSDPGMAIEIVLLGTGNPLPDRDRAGAATLVRAAGKTLLVDAGRGVCMRLAGAGMLPVLLDAVLVTHLHSDHICDLNDVVTTHWVMSQMPRSLAIYGPPRLREVTTGMRAMLQPDIEYRLAHHADLTWEPQIEVTELEPGVVLDDGGLRVVAARTDHRPVEPTLGYRFECDGKAAVLAGDTLPCAGLDELCRDADVYVQTVLRDDLVRRVPLQRFVDTIDYHSTVVQAAQTAQRCNVKTLVLTHQVPTPAPDAAEEWIAIAGEHFDGEIVFGDDLTIVSA